MASSRWGPSLCPKQFWSGWVLPKHHLPKPFVKPISWVTTRHACAPSSLLTCSLVQDTVIGWVVEVDQVGPGGPAIALAGCCEVGTVLGGCHLHCTVIAPPKVVPRATEVREGSPAGAEGARATHPVALALQFEKTPHCLQEREKSQWQRGTASPFQPSPGREDCFLNWRLCTFHSYYGHNWILHYKHTNDLLYVYVTKLWKKIYQEYHQYHMIPKSPQGLAGCQAIFLILSDHSYCKFLGFYFYFGWLVLFLRGGFVGSHLMVLLSYSWFSAQGSLLVVLRGPMLEI